MRFSVYEVKGLGFRVRVPEILIHDSSLQYLASTFWGSRNPPRKASKEPLQKE